MTKLRALNFTISLDGYGAGPNQSIEHGLGEGGEQLHEWFFPTRTWRAMTGQDGGETGLDDDFARAGVDGIGATIMGRNMFGPIRGEWGDTDWKGWWGDEPPYHHPVFVLTHYPHEPIEMQGGTTFSFVTDGIESALEQARAAAGDQDIRIGGGVSTVQQYVLAGLVDELHVPVSPVLLGAGERLFDGLAEALADYDVEVRGAPRAAHMRFLRR